MLDGILALLLAVRIASASRRPSIAELLFLVVLALGGIAGTGLWRRQPWAIYLGLGAAGGAVLLAAYGVITEGRVAGALVLVRYGLRFAVSGFVFSRLWVARSVSLQA